MRGKNNDECSLQKGPVFRVLTPKGRYRNQAQLSTAHPPAHGKVFGSRKTFPLHHFQRLTGNTLVLTIDQWLKK